TGTGRPAGPVPVPGVRHPVLGAAVGAAGGEPGTARRAGRPGGEGAPVRGAPAGGVPASRLAAGSATGRCGPHPRPLVRTAAALAGAAVAAARGAADRLPVVVETALVGDAGGPGAAVGGGGPGHRGERGRDTGGERGRDAGGRR